MDEAQRRRVDAVAQAAAVARPVVEDVAEVAVGAARAHLGADHAVRAVAQLLDVRRLDRLGEARPAAARLELVGRGEQRLAGDDVDVDPGLVVVEQSAGAGRLGAASLGDVELLRRQARRSLRGFFGTWWAWALSLCEAGAVQLSESRPTQRAGHGWPLGPAVPQPQRSCIDSIRPPKPSFSTRLASRVAGWKPTERAERNCFS